MQSIAPTSVLLQDLDRGGGVAIGGGCLPAYSQKRLHSYGAAIMENGISSDTSIRSYLMRVMMKFFF